MALLSTKWVTFGLRGRLLLAFAGISSFAVLAAAAGLFAFSRVGGALDEIATRKVPTVVVALELSERSKRTAAAGPALLNMTDIGSVTSEVATATSEIDGMHDLLAQLRPAGTDTAALAELALTVQRLSENLKALHNAVVRKIGATDRKAELLRDTFVAYREFSVIWTPPFVELQRQVIELQRSVTSPSVSTQDRLAIIEKLDKAMVAVLPLDKIQRVSAQEFEYLVRGASVEDPRELAALQMQAVESVRALDAQVLGIDAEISTKLLPAIKRLRDNATGPNGLFAAQETALNATAESRQLIAENAEFSNQLGGAVTALAQTSKASVTDASAEALHVHELGRAFLAAIVGLSLLSSALIVWLYVGRRIVNRITALSAGMLAITGGRRGIAVDTSGSDEIAIMGQAVEIFRRDAVELDALLAERAEAAVQLERKVEERTTELVVAKEAAEQASRTKSAFLASMSHELRTPLNTIIGLTEMLSENAARFGTEKAAEPLGRVLRAGRHLLSLINDILDLSKIEAGKMEMSLENVSVRPMVEEVVSAIWSMADKNRNKVILQCALDVPAIRADSIRIKQVLLNLLSNACKFTKDGEIELSVSRQDLPDRSMVHFAVRDTGIGMSADQVTRLFHEFTQVDQSATRATGGTGLGLAISRKLCWAMEGDISVTSELGKGSIFTAWIPTAENLALCRVIDAVAKIDPADRRDQSNSDDTPVVLVIDDDETARELICGYISEQGFRAVAVDNGVQGLRCAKELNPAVITLDVVMQGSDGWAVLAALKRDPELARIPVIMVTIVDERKRGLTLGAAGYLTKPIVRQQLAKLLKPFKESGRGSRVLMVQDDADQCAIIRELGQRMGWAVMEVDNGRAALERLNASLPDVILLDLMTREMEGFELIATLRQEPRWRAIPIFVVTTRDLNQHDIRRLEGQIEGIVQRQTMQPAEFQDQLCRHVASVMAATRRKSAEAVT
jgi:signal transduction histidine kinase/DNA-binding response OmpR family regulator